MLPLAGHLTQPGLISLNSTLQQLLLDLNLASEPGFGNFLPGSGRAVLQMLQAWCEPDAPRDVPVYLWGAAGTGKTHLLRAACSHLTRQGERVVWFDGTNALAFAPEGRWDAVIMDNAHLYDVEQQACAFRWMINALSPLQGPSRAVLAAGQLPPADLPLRDDLRSRLGWGHVFQLQPLPDAEVARALKSAARMRGMDLPDAVLSYLLTHDARDLRHLMTVVRRLDRFTLQTGRAVTIPLLKSMLDTQDQPGDPI